MIIYYVASCRLAEADIYINSNQPYATNGDPDFYDFQSVAVHEVGHAIGLSHPDGITSAAVMLSTIGLGEVVHIQPSDRHAVEYVYGAVPIVRLDLYVTSLSAGTSGLLGGSIAILETEIGNSGDADAERFRLSYYFSTDEKIEKSDVFAGGSCVYEEGLAVDASATCGPVDIAIPAGLSAGTYYLVALVDDLLRITETDELNNGYPADTGPVNLLGPDTPFIFDGGVVNGASFQGPVAIPGSIVSLFGSKLTSAPAITLATIVPLPTTLAGVSVTVNGVPAPLFAVANVNGVEQINLQVPWEATGQSAANIVVNRDGTSSASSQVDAITSYPGIFTVDGTAGAILHGTTNQLISLSDPATTGETIVIYATGVGPVTNPPLSGSAAGADPLSLTILPPTVTIAGLPATVVFSGLAPGFVGLYQLNVVVPSLSPSGPADVVIQSGGQSSNAAVIQIQ